MSRRRVAVLMGGRSSEHPISLASARSVISALDPERYDVVEVEIGRDGRWSVDSGHVPRELVEPAAPSRPRLPLPATSGAVAATLGEVEVVLPILHGPFGEDGALQGVLEMADVAYVGAGVAASAICMDKDLFKAVMRDQGVPVTRNITLRAGSVTGKAGDARPETRGAGSVTGKAGDARPESWGDGAPTENPFGYPVFVKPARLGSSVGITKAHDEEELRAAVALAFEHDEKVLVEEFVSGVEVEVGVLGNREPVASLVGEIVVTNNEWYDWQAKYDEGEMDLVVPARITGEQTLRVQQLAVQAFVATECEGIARVDCFVRDDGEVLVNELNTMPGFTATSVYAKLFEASGIPYGELLERAIDLALERRERRSSLRF
jgi:D-alanine-D-alanine ligase